MIFSRRFLAMPLAVAWLITPSLAGANDSARRLDPAYADVIRQLNEARQRVHILEEHLRQLEARRAREPGMPEVAKSEAKECGLPFTLDEQGIKHLRAECAPSVPEASCSMPFAIDATGIKRLRAECGG
jgi:hypothetical protein